MFEVLPTDKFFYDSPQAGDKNCICSRCGFVIHEEEAPVIRAWPNSENDYGYDPKR